MAQSITPVPGHDYEIAGSVAFEHEGHVQNGVFFTPDGTAFAGRVMQDAGGEFVALAWDADDTAIEAHPDWASMIVREIKPTALGIWAAA